MLPLTDRRRFLLSAAGLSAGLLLPAGPRPSWAADQKKPLFSISLAQWSLHKAFFANTLDARDFASVAKKEYGIEAVEYVNQFYKGKGSDEKFIADLRKRADDAGVKSVLIMCDGEGNLGDADEKKRTTAVENHHKWVVAAKILGCHSIRVNAASAGSYEEQIERAADGLRRLTEFGAKHEINVIVENHGGLSSNGEWLAAVMKKVDHQRCGTLPDFGNFRVSATETYDRYKGVQELMPFAKGVSAKSYNFDEKGEETQIDYRRMLKIVLEAGYKGYIGIEYEGSKLPEPEGIMATKKLLETVRAEMEKA